MEVVIENASKIKECLDALCELYCSLPKLLELEHDALKEADFEDVRRITMEKARVGEHIELEFARIQDCTEILSQSHAVITGTDLQESRATGMHACIQRLRDISGHSAGGNLASDVLNHVIDGLVKSTQKFEHKMIEIQPLVEMNKRVVNTMLQSYRESYLFWQELAEEAASSYTEKGVQKTKGRNSGFVAKA
jgi:hypothetical protein